jgi:hypothetical protein
MGCHVAINAIGIYLPDRLIEIVRRAISTPVAIGNRLQRISFPNKGADKTGQLWVRESGFGADNPL